MKDMAADVLSFNPHKANAYSEAVKFDLELKNGTSLSNSPVQDEENIDPRDVTFHPEVSTKLRPSRDWEIDVRGLISTKKWLQNYGLRKNRLDMHQILPTIGFKHSDEYDGKIKKSVCSRYGVDLFPKVNRNDGKSFNISQNRDKLVQIESRLKQAVSLYKRRLEWLTTESRRIFGVVEERAVSIVLDIKNMSPQQFDQYRAAVERILKEQVAQCAKFNIIRACSDMKPYEKECVPVTVSTIEGAIDWLWKLERLAPTGDTATCEAVSLAMADNVVEAVYLFTEGSSCDGSREILKEKVTGARIPLHVVSYNCTSPSTIRFLKDLTKITNARFHAYGIVMEMDHYEGSSMDPSTNQANIILRKKTFGGVPHGAGVREDVILLFEELEEARHTMSQVQNLLSNMPESKIKETLIEDRAPNENENYMSSREWLDKYGLKPQRLGFYDILASVAFKHRDGVIGLKEAPPNEDLQTDAVTRQKLVNARYCESFPHVRWRNGDLMHVQVTPDVHRSYEIRMNRALEGMQQRIDWLQQGSRELFGTVIEDQIYILIDTSASMDPHIQFVKDKLFVLMQEQLRHKQKFNLISFDSKVNPWWERLVDVNEKNLQGAWQWVKNLGCKGSTNSLAAIKLALSDPNTQAIYLLTDGRPDQPPKSILAQVQLQPQVPIHTISFNCSDGNANEFLCQLAKDTGGRFHYYSDHGMELEGPEPWESEDIRLLKQEKELGLKNLEQIGQLRDECAALAWKKEEPMSHVQKENASDRESAMPPFDSKNLYRSEILERPSTAPGFRHSPTPPPSRGSLSARPASSHGYRPTSAVGYRPTNRGRSIHMARPKSARASRTVSPRYGTKSQTPRLSLSSGILLKKNTTPLHAGHTRTSILRTLNSPGSFQQKEWLLPETKGMLDNQLQRQQLMNGDEVNTKEHKRKLKKMTNEKNISSKKWLAVHGLAPTKLTILDALAPTFIPHKPKFIPILNKHVLSKVFDDILPIAHASGQNRKRVRIINPQGVDLASYEKNVQAAVDKYTRRLNRIVWDALPQEEKDSFESEEPVSFMENRKEMINALDRCGWPLREQDIIRLENEIKQGCTYIQQAKDLQEMAENGGKSDDEGLTSDDQFNKKIFRSKAPRRTKKKDRLSMRYSNKPQQKPLKSVTKDISSSDENDHSDEKSVKSDGSNLSARSQGSQVSKGSQRSPRSGEGEYELKITHDTSAAGGTSTERRTSEVVMQKEQNFEGLGQARKKKGKKGKNKNAVTVTRVKKALDVLRGQRVIAKNPEDGFYYAGQVARCPDPRTALVMFDDIKSEVVPIRFIIPTSGAISRPPIKAGDYVLTRVINQDTGLECYIPGLVHLVPARSQDQTKFYTIEVYTGQKIHTLRGYFVKISRERYTFLVRYIREVTDDDEKEEETPRKDEKEPSVHSRSRSRSDSDTSSRSSRISLREKPKKYSNLRKYSRSASSSYSRSRSRSRSKSRSRSRSSSDRHDSNKIKRSSKSRSQSHSRSRSRKKKRKQRKRSRSSESRSSSSHHRKRSSSSKHRSKSREQSLEDASRMLRSDMKRMHKWQKRLEHQQRKQKRQQKRMRKHANKLAKVQKQIFACGGTDPKLEEKKRLLEILIQEGTPTKAASPRPPPDSPGVEQRQVRTQSWVSEQNGHGEQLDKPEKVELSTAMNRAKDKATDLAQICHDLRRSLEPVKEGIEVLARWSEEGWYYRGTVKQSGGDGSYFIEDSLGDLERIWREDIITDSDDADHVIQPHDTVIALHPSYSHSYAPGVIITVNPDLWGHVRFYDGIEAQLPREEIYRIPKEKFELDVAYILRCEDQWISEAVVARDEETGKFHLGSVKERVGNGRQYVIEWANGKLSVQGSSCIFGAFTKKRPLSIGDRVLAIADAEALVYLPGWISGAKEGKLVVKFCDGSVSSHIEPLQCFSLTEDYYNTVINYYKEKHPES